MFKYLIHFLCVCITSLVFATSDSINRSENIDGQCDTSVLVENQLRNVIFTAAVGNLTKLSQLNETDYCKYHTFTGALINLWFQLPISKSVNDIIREGIVDVTGTCPPIALTDNIDLSTLTKALDKIQERLTADATLNERYLDSKTAIETEMSTASNKTCRKDFTAESKLDKFSRFIIHQRFLDLASRQVDPKCDPAGNNRTILASSIIQVAKRPDVRPTVIRIYEESLFETAQNLTTEFQFHTGPPNCSIIIEDPNMETLLNKLNERVQKDNALNTEVELIKKELAQS